jgi:hypothetical protein
MRFSEHLKFQAEIFLTMSVLYFTDESCYTEVIKLDSLDTNKTDMMGGWFGCVSEIVMTPSKRGNVTSIRIEKVKKSQIDPSMVAHTAGGQHSGLVINKQSAGGGCFQKKMCLYFEHQTMRPKCPVWFVMMFELTLYILCHTII